MSYSYPYTAHLLDKVGESSNSQSLSAIPPTFPPVEAGDLHANAQNRFSDRLDDRSNATALYRNQDDEDTLTTSTNVRVEQQTHNQHHNQHQSQLLLVASSPIGLVVSSGPGPKSHKRKAQQPMEPQPPPPLPPSTCGQAALPVSVRSELEWARYNTMQEAGAVFNSQQVRRANLHPSTLKAYDIYREHWFEWCNANHYRDYTVTNSRAARYFQEAFGEPDPLNPGIVPLRRQKSRKDALGDYLMPETMDFYIKAVVDLWNEQATEAPSGSRPGTDVSPRKIARPFMEAYKRKIGVLTKATKFQGLRITEGYNKQGFKRMMKSYWTRNYVQEDQKNRRKLNGFRDRLNLSWTHFMMCRGENTRMALLQDLNFHAFEFSDATGQFILGIVLTMLQGKMNADGKMLYGVVVRNKDVETCPVGSLAFYLFEMFMDPRVCPDFSTPDWGTRYLVFASNPTKPMSTSTHYTAQKQEMQAANILSSKVTHAGRRAGAQQAQSAGATIDEIAQHGNWLHHRVVTHYLSEIPERVPLMLAGFTNHQERFWIARNALIPPVDLQKLIFPVLNDAYPDKDWDTWMENIMTDKDEYDNRQLDQRLASKYPQQDSQKIKFFILLAHLRKVILQDAAALMDINIDPQCQYDLHHIFLEPAFRSPLFIQFRADLRQKMATSRSPISDSLLTSAPAIQHGLRDISDRLGSVMELLRHMPSTADMHRDRELWSASIGRQVDHMREDLVSVHDGLISTNNAIACNLNAVQQTLTNVLVSAVDVISATKVTEATIPPLRPRVPFFSPSLPQPTPLQLQPQSRPEEQQFPSGIQSGLPGNRLPPPPSVSPPPASPPQSPASQPSLPGSPPPQQYQSSTAGALPAAIHQATVDLNQDLEALAESLASPRHKPVISTYTMKPRPRVLEPLWQEWFHGVAGEPSIWQMNKHYKWRKNADAAMRKHYAFNRAIIESVLKAISEAKETSFELRKEAGMLTVKERIAKAGSLNKYFLQLNSKT